MHPAVDAFFVLIVGAFATYLISRLVLERIKMEKELKLKARLLDTATDSILLYRPDGSFVYVNEAAYKSRGYTREQLMAMNRRDFAAPECAGHFDSRLKEIVDKRKGIFESVHLCKNGDRVPVEIHARAIKVGGEDLILGVCRDITERKRAEELFKTVTNSSPVGIYIVQDRKFQLANPQFQKLTGYTEDELAGMDSLVLVLPEDRDKVREKAIKMLKGEQSSPYQFRVVNKSGEIRWVMETATSIQYQGRRATLGNYMDVTERKQMEEQLMMSERLASVGELASGIAHELNNPLTSVIGFSQLLMERNIADDIREDLGLVYSEAQRAAGVVRNLLTFARKHSPVKQLSQINDVIEDVLRLRAYEQRVNNIGVNRRFASGLPEVMVDYFQMQQVFLNIIINAEYFMTQAHNRGTLTITTERFDNIIRISFADDGPGIFKEDLSRIFDPFFTTKEVGKGTGLGLSICHGIVAGHGGSIYARSRLGKGATFVVELPINGSCPKQEVRHGAG